MARILFVEQFYYPEGWGGAEIPRAITSHLARSGYDVDVICGSDLYAPVVGNPGPDPAQEGINIHRVPRLFRGDVHRAKLLRQVWFYAVLAPILFGRRPPDLYVAQTNPPLAVVLTAVAARLFRRPLIVVTQDLYPDVLFAGEQLEPSSLGGRMLSRLFGWAFRSAERVVALGPVMAQRLQDKGVAYERIVEISNWATGVVGVNRGVNSLATQWGLRERFVLLYSGNLGIGHEFDTLLRGFKESLAECPESVLVFVGRGRRLAEVESLVARYGLNEVTSFRDLVSPDQLPESYGLADLAVVTLRDGFEGLMVPSKLLGCLARGLPVLYVGPDSDAWHFVNESGCGYAVRPGDSDGVREAIRAAYHDREGLAARAAAGRRYYDAHISLERALVKYDSIVSHCLGLRHSL